jgi:hypothetical protein
VASNGSHSPCGDLQSTALGINSKVLAARTRQQDALAWSRSFPEVYRVQHSPDQGPGVSSPQHGPPESVADRQQLLFKARSHSCDVRAFQEQQLSRIHVEPLAAGTPRQKERTPARRCHLLRGTTWAGMAVIALIRDLLLPGWVSGEFLERVEKGVQLGCVEPQTGTGGAAIDDDAGMTLLRHRRAAARTSDGRRNVGTLSSDAQGRPKRRVPGTFAHSPMRGARVSRISRTRR